MKVAMVGNLSNIGYINCRFIRENTSIRPDLFISKFLKEIPQTQNPKNEYPSEPVPPWVYELNTRNPFRLVKGLFDLRKYDLIHAYTLSPIYCQFAARPLISHATGSDLREFVFHKTIQSRLLFGAYKKSKKILVTTFDLLDSLSKLKLRDKGEYMPLIVDMKNYTPQKNKDKSEELTLFAPARWDWRIKGIDILLKAFAGALRKNKSLSLTMIDFSNDINSPDSKKTVQLIKDLNIGHKVNLIEQVQSKRQLIQLYNRYDIIVDQFNAIGGIGLIDLETLSCGKPLLHFLNVESAQKHYRELPPILNCQTEKQITDTLLYFADKRKELEAIGKKSREWVEKYHNPRVISRRYKEIYESVMLH